MTSSKFICTKSVLLKLFFSALLICTGKSIAQSNDSTAACGLNVQLHYGFLIAHRPTMQHLQQKHSLGFELDYLKPADGRKISDRIYNYPQTGVGLIFLSSGNKDVLGFATGIYPFIDFPLSKNKKAQLNFRFGFGLGYVQKNFDNYENFKNTAIGSQLNALIALRFKYEFRINETLRINTGIGITHFSNGSFKTPNLGINMASLNLGLSKYFGKVALHSEKVPDKKKRWNYEVFAGGFKKQIYPALGKNYFAMSLVGNSIFEVNHKSNFVFGADFFYDESLATKLENRGDDNSPSQVLRIGLQTGYHLTIDNFTMGLDLGVYVYDQWGEDGIYFHRFVMNEKINDHLIICFNLKSHFAKADYFELGLGWRFKK